MNEKVNKVKNSIDWGLVLTLIVTAILLAAVVMGMKKSGFKPLAEVAKNVG